MRYEIAGFEESANLIHELHREFSGWRAALPGAGCLGGGGRNSVILMLLCVVDWRSRRHFAPFPERSPPGWRSHPGIPTRCAHYTPVLGGVKRWNHNGLGRGVPKVSGSRFLSPRGRLRSATGRGAGDWLRSGMLFAAKVPVPAVRDNTGDRHRRTAWRSQSPAPLPPQGARINRNAYKKVRRRDLQTAKKYMHTPRGQAFPFQNRHEMAFFRANGLFMLR